MAVTLKPPHLKGIIWISSSGTSDPETLKFIGLSRSALEASARAVIRHLKLSARDRIYNPLPLTHVGGLGTKIRAQILGCKWVDGSRLKWSPQLFAKALEKHSISTTSLVPTQVFDLAKNEIPSPKTLRSVVVGGGRLDFALYRKARDLGWPLLPSYGMTEHGSQLATAPLDSLKSDEEPRLQWLSHVKSIQNIQTREGKSRIFIHSKSQCTYIFKIKKSGETQLEFFTPQYGIPAEDLLEWNEKDRTLKVLGRQNSEVKVLGVLVNLEQLEVRFRSHIPAGNTQDIFVNARPHARSENQVVLYVEGLKNFKLWDRIVEQYNLTTPGPHRINSINFMSKFPRTPLGKIVRSQIS